LEDPLAGMKKSGDVYGDPDPGHKVTKVWAVVITDANGSEGLASYYTFIGTAPVGRVTLVASTEPVRRELQELVDKMEPPAGGSIEWREFHV
jgi:hypothetical protein